MVRYLAVDGEANCGLAPFQHAPDGTNIVSKRTGWTSETKPLFRRHLNLNEQGGQTT